MFRLSGLGPARPADETAETATGAKAVDEADAPNLAPPLKPFSKTGSHMPSTPVLPQTPRSEIPRRILDIPGAQRKPPTEIASENKRLVVGREIRLSGVISACDCLVVEGQVEADLTDAQTVIVNRGGVFRGTAVVANAEISGLFDGDLTVQDTATIKPGGIVRGTIHYANVVMEKGGIVEGTLKPLPRVAPSAKVLIADPGEVPQE